VKKNMWRGFVTGMALGSPAIAGVFLYQSLWVSATPWIINSVIYALLLRRVWK
jgi:hypothetical protein